MWRGIAVGSCLALLVVGVVSGQGQRSPATLDDLLREIRGLRADLTESLRGTTRSQLVMGRVQVQEQRISSLKGELFNTQMLLRIAAQERERTDATATAVEDGIRSGNLATERARQLEKELADVKDRLYREQRTENELRNREAELANTLAIEQNRWTDFNSRLDELERALLR
jgi:chromosome segregation ATPase